MIAGIRILPRDTFRILTERGSRFTRILEIEGPVDECTDAELLLHFGGDPDRSSVTRFPADVRRGVVYAWED